MKKIIEPSVLILTLLCFFIFCGDNGTTSSSPDNSDNRLSIVGDWVAQIDLSSQPTLGKYVINLLIKTVDSSFQLTIAENYQINNTIYIHSGTWRIGKSNLRGGDPLYLIGRECQVLDTTVTPAEMRQMPDSIAKQTITLDTTRTKDDEWIINLGSLTPYMAYTLPPQAMPVISLINLTFKRKEKVFIRY